MKTNKFLINLSLIIGTLTLGAMQAQAGEPTGHVNPGDPAQPAPMPPPIPLPGDFQRSNPYIPGPIPGPAPYAPNPLPPGAVNPYVGELNNALRGTPPPDYSRVEAELQSYRHAADYYRNEIERQRREAMNRSTTGHLNPSTTSSAPVIRPIIDPETIPDPLDSELPYSFQSPSGQARDSLIRTYKDLYKIKPEYGKCQKARELGLYSVEEADQAYASGHPEEAGFYHELAVGFLDLAVGLVPVTGMAQSTFGLIVGRNFVTGAQFTNWEYGFAALNVVTLGTEGLIGSALKGLIKIVTRGAKFVRSAELTSEGIKVAERAIGAATTLLDRAPLKRELAELTLIAKNAGNKFDDLHGFVSGKLKRFGPINPGPLHELAEGTGTVADTFRSSSYFENVLSKPVTLYRVYSREGGELAQYWSRVKPTGPYQAVLDSALDPSWGNKAVKWVEITVPANEVIYEGIVSSVALEKSGLTVGNILGGGSQVHINRNIPPEWLTASGVFK